MKITKTKAAVLVSGLAVVLVAYGYCPYSFETSQSTHYELCVAFGNPPPPCVIGDRYPGDERCVQVYEDMGVYCVISPKGKRATCVERYGTPVYNAQMAKCECDGLGDEIVRECTAMTLDLEYCP